MATPALHPAILKKNGQPEFVVLPFDEYTALLERLEDARDILDLRAAKARDRDKPGLSIAKVRAKLARKAAPKTRPKL